MVHSPGRQVAKKQNISVSLVLVRLARHGIRRAERPGGRHTTDVVGLLQVTDLANASYRLVTLGSTRGQQVAQVRASRVLGVEVAPAGVVARRLAARRSVVHEERRRPWPVRESGADGDGSEAHFSLLRIGQRRLQVAHAIDCRIPAQVRVPEDVHVGAELVDAAGEVHGAAGLSQRREEEVSLLRHELRARHKVRGGDHGRAWVLGPKRLDTRRQGRRTAVVHPIESARYRVVRGRERRGPRALVEVAHHELCGRDALPTDNVGLRIPRTVVPRQDGRDDRAGRVCRRRVHAQPTAEREDLFQPLDRVDLGTPHVEPARELAPDPHVVVAWREEDVAKSADQYTERLLQEDVARCDVAGQDEAVAPERIVLGERAAPLHVGRVICVEVACAEDAARFWQ
mmetsp:Transcript_54228/g.160997  ORF Transcript_54228/g.160997 Transcript_54228/m.160997 type:complete len:400 (-) Transcript_54228:460-1659(-)